MELYKNRKNSGVQKYSIHETYIAVWFSHKDGLKMYKYSYGSASKKHVERMKELALLGKGLNTYITHNTKDKFVKTSY